MADSNSHVVGVRFRNAGKIYYFDSAGMRLEPGEYVVVQTARGPEVGRVVIGTEQVVVNELGDDDLQPILRLAAEADLLRADTLRERAKEILPEARQLADESGLPAHIDTADFTLDGSRLTFSFTSEERVDYREFVKKAAERFGAKVDMRQLGARDRAKLAGGYGICGRELCCSSWLTTFPSISIRMAKDQELPLNPQKISGLCGRLLCCLSYEEEGYREMRATLPKIGQRCSTPTGEGKVIAVNILRRQVTLVVAGTRVDVGDRDLGTVVRWDTSSKTAEPPPSLTRAEAVEQGLLDPSVLDEEELDAPEGWVVRETAGRGRLPGGGPRKVARPRPEPATQEPARPSQGRGRGRSRGSPRQGQPGEPESQAKAHAPRPVQPPGPPPGSRVFRRAGQEPGERPETPANEQPRPEGGGGARRRRGRRGGRGRGQGPTPD